MRRHRNTKIVATLGPASSTHDQIENLFLNGADVFRLNFSHGTHADHKARIDIIRAIEKKHNHPITILADMQGPKLRIGKFSKEFIEVTKGQKFTLYQSEELGDEHRVSLPHPELYAVLTTGTELLLDDGKVRLKVLVNKNDIIETEVVIGGRLSNHKGLNVPGVKLPIPILTEKDIEDMEFALQHGADIIALSFVQTPEDVIKAKKLIGGRAKVGSKIEKPSAIDHLEEIINQSDAIMVARGDLGVEMPPEEVPSLQKRINRLCRYAGKPVIVATQMLESMITNATPTRAEATDVANAVYEGADAVMLSAESASGEFPNESVQMMGRIISQVESDSYYRMILNANRNRPDPTAADAITMAANQVSRTISAKAIVTFTTSGSTTIRASRERPEVPILAITSSPATARFLNLAWGVHSVLSKELVDFFHISEETSKLVVEKEFAVKGDFVVITAGLPNTRESNSNIFVSGSTNLVEIIQVE